MCRDINLFVLTIKSSIGVECSETPFVEAKVFDFQACPCLRIGENGIYICLTRCQTVEIDRMEIQEIENVLNVNILKVNRQAVLLVGSCQSVDRYVLVIMVNGEIVHREMLVTIDNI